MNPERTPFDRLAPEQAQTQASETDYPGLVVQEGYIMGV